MERHIVIGTAGHIDHGKSALLKVLTGIDPDRLKEEKERGMTTDLGFAYYTEKMTIIDVPGHEKFVRHMVVGASTIDMVLLCIAADDGVMPQTVEHFEILKLLGIKKGMVVITKKDLVDEGWLEVVREDIEKLVKGSFLEDAPIITVSNTTGEGIEEVKEAISILTSEIEFRQDTGIFRLPIDRLFTLRGFGTIVAGTVLSGTVKVGDRVEVLPQKIEARIRGVQKQQKYIETTRAGDRAALNINVEREKLERGNVVAQPGFFKPTEFINGSLFLLNTPKPLKNRIRIRLYMGTAEIMARVVLLDREELKPGEEGLVQLRLEKPTVCSYLDRFIIRSYSPITTIGGGRVLEPNPEKERRFYKSTISRLQLLKKEDPKVRIAQKILESGFKGITLKELSKVLSFPLKEMEERVKGLIEDKVILEERGSLIHIQNLERLDNLIIERLKKSHRENPLKMGLKPIGLKNLLKVEVEDWVWKRTVEVLKQDKKITEERDKLRLYGHRIEFNEEEERLALELEKIYKEGKFSSPLLKEIKTRYGEKAERIVAALTEMGKLVDVGEGLVFHIQNIEEAQRMLEDWFNKNRELRAFQFKELLNTSRKYALPLLRFFDDKGITQRRGEIRVRRGG